MKRPAFNPDQASFFGEVSPVTGDVSIHPPFCCCGSCPMPVERFEPQPAAALLETADLEPWGVA